MIQDVVVVDDDDVDPMMVMMKLLIDEIVHPLLEDYLMFFVLLLLLYSQPIVVTTYIWENFGKKFRKILKILDEKKAFSQTNKQEQKSIIPISKRRKHFETREL